MWSTWQLHSLVDRIACVPAGTDAIEKTCPTFTLSSTQLYPLYSRHCDNPATSTAGSDLPYPDDPRIPNTFSLVRSQQNIILRRDWPGVTECSWWKSGWFQSEISEVAWVVIQFSCTAEVIPEISFGLLYVHRSTRFCVIGEIENTVSRFIGWISLENGSSCERWELQRRRGKKNAEISAGFCSFSFHSHFRQSETTFTLVLT